MKYYTDAYYRQAADYQRRRHTYGGYPWPGKPFGAVAVTRYPNILAELEASGYWIKTFAEFAEVSPEIMASVIEDGEELTDHELQLLAWRWERRGPGYLSAPVLQIVDPDTNKGKRRMRELADLINEAEDLPDPVEDVYGLHTYWRREVVNVYEVLQGGYPCTFADWWWACHKVREALKAEATKHRQHVRTKRQATA